MAILWETTTYTFGSDAQLVRDAIGQFHVDVNANAVGVWYWRWETTSTYQGAAEGTFEVPASPV